MFEKLTDIIVNYVEVDKEAIKPESRFMEEKERIAKYAASTV